MISAINLEAAFEGLSDHWSPRVVARVNDQYVKVAKVKGQLAWHKHDAEDELFQVVHGQLRIEFEGGRDVVLNEGEFCVVPKGVLHNPIADEECWILLVETVTRRGDPAHEVDRRSVADGRLAPLAGENEKAAEVRRRSDECLPPFSISSSRRDRPLRARFA